MQCCVLQAIDSTVRNMNDGGEAKKLIWIDDTEDARKIVPEFACNVRKKGELFNRFCIER